MVRADTQAGSQRVAPAGRTCADSRGPVV